MLISRVDCLLDNMAAWPEKVLAWAFTAAHSAGMALLENVLATSSLSPHLLGDFFNDLVKLKPLTSDLPSDHKKMPLVRQANAEKLLKAVKKHKPDLIVGDFHLSDYQFIFYPLKYVLDRVHLKTVFIWRIDDLKKFPFEIFKMNQ